MKNRLFTITSFKKKLIAAFLAIGLIPLISASLIFLGSLNQRIIKDTEAASIEKLRYLGFNVRRQVDMSEQLLGWITFNSKLQKILTKEYGETYEKQLDIIDFSSYVTEYCINADLERNIIKILITDMEGNSFQMGNSYSLLRVEEIEAAGWMETYRGRQADELADVMDWYLPKTKVFPMSSNIFDNLTGKVIGHCLIVFSDSMYSNQLVASVEEESQEKLFIMNQEGQCIANINQERQGSRLDGDPLIDEILNSSEEMGHVTGNYEGESMIFHYYQIPDTDMTIVQGVSLENFLREKREVTSMVVLTVIVTIGAILLVVFYLSGLLAGPINTISDYIKRAPERRFRGKLELKGNDEFQKIAQAINTMEQETLALMEKEKQEAEIKKHLEFQVLQNQINPHFLYNTLNSIKWMASLQHADTIRDMTAALGRLLQNISRGTDCKIPIYEEMSLLDDYILIQDIRYGGKIKVEYHIGNREVTQAYIIKFLLQPIVENAIFHGIEPNGGEGKIAIGLDIQEGDVLIGIMDDGIGMTKEQIEDLLNPENGRSNDRGLSGIGVSNIQERIKLEYGEGYGIEIVSETGRFTKVTIRIPYEKEGLI